MSKEDKDKEPKDDAAYTRAYLNKEGYTVTPQLRFRRTERGAILQQCWHNYKTEKILWEDVPYLGSMGMSGII